MKILSGQEIQKAIIECKPNKIAVAYIGADWERFIPNNCNLKEAIVSPTFGTNPHAVNKLAEKIQWANLYFLYELHAKIYLGTNFSVVGSPNLTQNGLSGHGLLEVCVEVNDKINITKLESIYDEFKKKAIKQFPDTKSKIKLVAELQRKWNSSQFNSFSKNLKIVTSFQNFELSKEDEFYVCWHQGNGERSYSEEYINIKHLIKDTMHFSKEDEVQLEKWVLSWQINNFNYPHKRARLKWIFINKILDEGVTEKDYVYPKFGIELKGDDRLPSPPFELTPEVEAAFKIAVKDAEIAKYLIQDVEPFKLSLSAKGLPLLINKMKQILNI